MVSKSSTTTTGQNIERRDSVEAEDQPMWKRYPMSAGYWNSSSTFASRVRLNFGSFIPKVSDGSWILDFGCSLGLTTIALANIHKKSNVIGIDINRVGYLANYCGVQEMYSAMKECRFYLGNGYKKSPYAFLIADGFHAPFKDGSFEAVYCMNNLYYLLKDIKPDLLTLRFNQVGRVVKEGGYLLISGNNAGIGSDSIVLQKRESGFQVVSERFSSSADSHDKREILFRLCRKVPTNPNNLVS